MIFLTGATGFIGQALLNRFLSEGIKVSVLIRNKSTVLPSGVERFVGNLSTISDIDAKALSQVDVVVHAAARAHIMHDASIDPLTEYRKENRDATIGLARRAAQSGVKRFVFISSIKVNGEATVQGKLFKPDIDAVPTDPYGLSKYEAEQGLLEVATQTGMEVVIIRPPLVYGPGVKGNFSSMIKWVKKGIPLPFGLVENQRSMVALDNLIDFITLCADRQRSPEATNQIFLISDNKDISTAELCKKVAEIYGVPSRLLRIPVGFMKFIFKFLGQGSLADRLFENLQIDSSKARDLLGWKPVITMDGQLQEMAVLDGLDKKDRLK